jgi:hypothetical protein
VFSAFEIDIFLYWFVWSELYLNLDLGLLLMKYVTKGLAVMETHVCDRINTFSLPSHARPASRALRHCTHGVQVSCILLSKGQLT